MAGGSYIAYIIHTDFRAGALHCESKHRYSEFEALRKLLTKLYPTVVVPPIPEKHTVGAYAAKPTKAKEDPRIIQRRTRMLQAFLNRVAAHPSLRGEHVFHQFLEGGVTWGDILAQSGLGHFLKRKDTSVKVSDRGALKHPDTHFALAEDYTIKFGSQISHMYKVYRSLHRQHVDMTGTYSDLGAAYNGWSLSEGPLSHAIEQVGQAVDTTVAATSQLAHNAEMGLGEPLLEYQLYSKAVDKLLRWRHKKHAEFEALSDQLIAKKASLLKLEASESEAQRLAAVLNAEGMAGHARPSSGGGGGLMATLNSLIDNDPATTRRNNISKTKDRIAALEAQRELCRVELGTANEEIQKDLDRFQMDKIKDFRNMLLSFALAQREYHRKAAKAWEEAKGEVERIQP
ncbi:hypothetical protein BC832DRAFT_531952 [Gaertneriomyces semiglobifer]|nr:hypothetical protein BC832DRAFT_531952 [Gaertneriomyces semiglobifer]